MFSETDVLNDSLGQIGANFIDGIDDGSVNANHCQRLYPPLRKALLRMHYWNFATKRLALAAEPTAPPFEYMFAFPLPADFLRMIEYNGSNRDASAFAFDPLQPLPPPDYQIESGKLLTNDGTVQIVYTADVTNPALWDPLFYQALTGWLAAKLAMPITKDAALSRSMLDIAVKLLLPLATAVDGQDNPVRPLISDALTRGR